MIDSRFMPPLSQRHPHDKVDRALFYYATLRPHQGLAGATPTEIYFGITPTRMNSASPPRRIARAPSEPRELPFEIAYLDPERRLAILVPGRSAA